jgi:hypothetical protein
MKDLAIFIRADPARAPTVDAVVRDARSESRHRLRWRGGTGRKESVPGAFDMRVIRRYFPEFDDAFPSYLAHPRGEAGEKADRRLVRGGMNS